MPHGSGSGAHVQQPGVSPNKHTTLRLSRCQSIWYKERQSRRLRGLYRPNLCSRRRRRLPNRCTTDCGCNGARYCSGVSEEYTYWGACASYSGHKLLGMCFPLGMRVCEKVRRRPSVCTWRAHQRRLRSHDVYA